MNEEKKQRYFTNKDIVRMAVMAAALFVVSCITVPIVLGVPFPGIRTLACGLFFGVIIALTYARVPKFGAGTVTTLICSLPMAFFSPIITVFTTAAGFCTDLYFLLVGKKLTVKTITGLGAVLMGTMMPIAAAMGAIFVPETELTWADLFRNPLYLAIGFFGSLILGGLGSFLATKIFKELKGYE